MSFCQCNLGQGMVASQDGYKCTTLAAKMGTVLPGDDLGRAVALDGMSVAYSVAWASKGEYFTFSPGISTSFNNTHAGFNFSDQNSFLEYPSTLFGNWLLCGTNGSCMKTF